MQFLPGTQGHGCGHYSPLPCHPSQRVCCGVTLLVRNFPIEHHAASRPATVHVHGHICTLIGVISYLVGTLT